MKKILIIGASGFVGKSLIDYLFRYKGNIDEIISISRKNFIIKNKSKVNLKKINKNFLKLKDIPEVDYIIYLIRSNSITKGKKYFKKFKQLINKFNKKPNILFVSSGAVYGRIKKKFKVKENLKITNKNIKSLFGYKKNYAKEKIFLEKEFKKLSKNGYKVSIARCFTFYGKYILKYNYAISDIINSIIKNKLLTVNDSHNIFRSYMYSDEMCKWLIKILRNSNVKCPVYNVGSDKETNIYKIAHKLSRKYNLSFSSKKNGIKEIDYYVPSTILAKKVLQLKNTLSMKNGIEKILKEI